MHLLVFTRPGKPAASQCRTNSKGLKAGKEKPHSWCCRFCWSFPLPTNHEGVCQEHFSVDVMKSWPSCCGFAHGSWFQGNDQTET